MSGTPPCWRARSRSGPGAEVPQSGWSIIDTVAGPALPDLADRSGRRQEVETLDVVNPETNAASTPPAHGSTSRPDHVRPYG